MIGWWSWEQEDAFKKQAEVARALRFCGNPSTPVVYGTEDGQEFIATMVTNTHDASFCKFGDLVCLGEVGEFKRKAKPEDFKLIGKKGKGAS